MASHAVKNGRFQEDFISMARAGGRLSTQHIISMRCISTTTSANLSLGKRGGSQHRNCPPSPAHWLSWSLPAHGRTLQRQPEVLVWWFVAYVAHVSVAPVGDGGGPGDATSGVMCSYLACSHHQGWHGAKSAICFLCVRFPLPANLLRVS